MRIVTLHAIPDGRRMNRALDLGRVLVGMAGKTEGLRSGRDQLYPSNIFISADFMATRASHGDRGMDRFTLGLVFMAGKASGAVGLGVE